MEIFTNSLVGTVKAIFTKRMNKSTTRTIETVGKVFA
jgi:hypothetical protein